MLSGYFSECEHVLFAVECACRVARVADEDRLRARCHKFLELFDRRNFESVLYVGVHGFQDDPAFKTECVVVRVEWLDHDEFVAFIAGYLKREVDSLASSHGDDDLRDGDFYADTVVISLRQPLAQLRQTRRICVGDVVQSIICILNCTFL